MPAAGDGAVARPGDGAVARAGAGSIQVSARPGLGLRVGDTVSLNVLKRLADGKWAVGLQGRVLSARSDLDLSPGATLRARVQSAGSKVVFVLEGGPANPLLDALRRLGVAPTAIAQHIASALVRSGLPVDPSTITRVRALLAKTRLDPRRAARAAATMLDKGIDLSAAGVPDLLELLCLGEPGGRDSRRWRGRPFPRDGGEARRSLALSASPEAPASGLAVYNALKGRSETWIVVPFQYRDGGIDCPGTLRLLVDPHANRLRKLVVGIRPAGAEAWHFQFSLEGARRMSVFCDDAIARRAAGANLDRLLAKVHNMGMEVDDTVGEGQEFDGFSPAGGETALRVVDAVG